MMTGEYRASSDLPLQRILQSTRKRLDVAPVSRREQEICWRLCNEALHSLNVTALSSMGWTTTSDAHSLRYLVFSGLTPTWTYRVSPSQIGRASCRERV